MYPKKTLSLAIAALSGCMALSAAYNVTGKLDNNGGSRIFLVTQTGKNTMDTIATSLTPDGSFTFTGNISAPMAARYVRQDPICMSLSCLRTVSPTR